MSDVDLPEDMSVVGLPSSVVKSELSGQNNVTMPHIDLPGDTSLVGQVSSLVQTELSGGVGMGLSGDVVIDSVHSRPAFYAETGQPSSDLLVLDSIYIKKHLGIPLTLALAEIVTKRPSDPIHYLGHWLLKWRWNQEQKQLHEDRVYALIDDRKKIADTIREELRAAEEEKRQAVLQLRLEAEQAVAEELDYILVNMELIDPPVEPEVVEEIEEQVAEELLGGEAPVDAELTDEKVVDETVANEQLDAEL